MLATTERGLSDLAGADPTVRPIGIYNVATFGRSVTLVLQTLRSAEPQFDAWYQPHVAEMSGDPLCTYFKDLRNEILKEGPPAVTSSVFIEHLTGAEMAALMTNPPPGARGFFIGDPLGGSGWEVELPDGSVQKFYVKLPSTLRIAISLHLPDPPNVHIGQLIADPSIEGLCHLYVTYLRALVTEAEQRFA